MTDQRLLNEQETTPSTAFRADSLEGGRLRLKDVVASLLERTPSLSRKLFRIEVEVPYTNPLLWLSAQTIAGRGYFCDRQKSYEMAAVGSLAVVTESSAPSSVCRAVRSIIGNTSARALGGFRFEAAMISLPEWNGFGQARFVIPRFDLVHTDGRCHLSMNIILDGTATVDSLLQEIDSLNLFLPRLEVALPPIVARDDQPLQTEWTRQVESILNSVRESSVQKAVLARRTTLDYFEPVDAISLLSRMHEREVHCYGYYMEDSAGRGFVSVSPERLYRREASTIEVEALAGTRPRSTSPSDDDRLAQELQSSAKDLNEHRFVVRFISETLNELCTSIECSKEPEVVRFRRVQHLQTLFRGQLRPDVDDDLILARLHPTPAVAGYPAETSRHLIRSLESFDRGWYAGPVGSISATGAEFAVGIRSALVDDRKVHLYAGCGIVEGSDPAREWDEIETKISGFMELFSGQ
ncbi:MAG: isochorismate synthase [Candidatus Zixiibacteriota bacterium]